MDGLVVGAGVLGLSAALHLARLGARVTVLERFALGHARGSSHGEIRIIRSAYPESLWVRLVGEARAEDWPRLERDGGATLITPAAGCFFGPRGGDIDRVEAAVSAAGADVTTLGTHEAMRVFPAFRLSAGDLVLSDRTAGVIRAAETMRALARLARAAGVSLREHARVVSFESAPARVRLEDGEAVEADVMVLAPGPFTPALLPDAPLVPARQHVAYYAMEGGAALPVWASFDQDQHYGLPDVGAGAKVALHGVHPASPDDPEVELAPDPAALAAVDAFVRRRFTAPARRVHAETCFYTMAPGEDFVADVLREGVAAGAGLSGHGFKLAPLFGRILAELAVSGRSTSAAFEGARARFALRRPAA